MVAAKALAGGSPSEPFAAPANDGKPHPRAFARHGLSLAGWMVPSVLMALIPKCPACLAAYAAGATGLGLSLSAAAYVRAALLILCIASLLYLVMKRLVASSSLNGALVSQKSPRTTTWRVGKAPL